MSTIKKLNPKFSSVRPVPQYMIGEKMYKLSTFSEQLEAKPGDTIKVRLSSLTCNSDECIIPSTFCLKFDFVNSNTKSRFLNNLSRLLTKHLQVRIGDEIVHDNTCKSTLNLYRDMWLSENTRKKMIRYGIANLNTRKLKSGDDSGSDSATTDGVTDKTLSDNYKSFKLRLGQVLDGYEYQITLP